MKVKKVLTLVLVIIFLASSFVYAEKSLSENDLYSGKVVSQGVDANLWKGYTTLKASNEVVAPTYYPSEPPKFWVEWFNRNGSQAFSSNYIHYQLVHRSSCTNDSEEYSSSDWEQPSVLAYSWLYSTLSNNKAYYDYITK